MPNQRYHRLEYSCDDCGSPVKFPVKFTNEEIEEDRRNFIICHRALSG